MDNQQSSLLELASSFLRLGFTALGGPAAHIAMLHDEVVTRRGWLTEQHFLDLIGATNLIPGPNSTEMVTHVATIGIFATSLVFVALLNPYVPRLREVPWTAVLLDGVNVASLGLMAGVTVILGRAALVDPLTIVIALVTAGASVSLPGQYHLAGPGRRGAGVGTGLAGGASAAALSNVEIAEA